jgi:3-methyladenine DNA glycosylase/8-oxoguanine DNA glycosylase
MKEPVKLRLFKIIRVKPTKPFAFDPTFHKPDHFTSGDNHWEPGVRWQTWNWKNKLLGIKFTNKGSVDRPLIEIKIYTKEKPSESFLNSLIEEIKYRYNLNLELDDFYKTFKKDVFLYPILKKWRGMRPGHPSSLYEYLIIGIVLQNAPVRRSVQMFQALLENYGTLLDFDGKKLWCFWKPGKLRKISEGELRMLKVGYRAKSIKKIDNYFVQNLVDEQKLREKDRETQMRELLKLYGVGPATVWYLLFDVFHHWDFFNHISPWEQKIYSKIFFKRSSKSPVPVKKLLKHFEKYGKYKQLTVHYLWEDIFWQRKQGQKIAWLEKEIRL